jgi:hypothetical protein
MKRALALAFTIGACSQPGSKGRTGTMRDEGRTGPDNVRHEGSAGHAPLAQAPDHVRHEDSAGQAHVPNPDAGHTPAEGRPSHTPLAPLPTEFATDAEVTRVAEDIRKVHAVALTLERDHMMDGGYRGMVHIIPKAPIGADRRHLAFLRAALDTSAAFGSKVASLAPAPAPAKPSRAYMFLPTEVRFFRTEPKRTPSAYAIETRIAYNLVGTLMQTRESVIETMVHEVFHLNDQAHNNWSETALAPIHARLVSKCAKNSACLAPYAPGTTMVRGGTYYAFQPGNGPGEYAAELMVRIYREVIARPKKPFKCVNDVNAEAHQKLTTEFFGFDPVPGCP